MSLTFLLCTSLAALVSQESRSNAITVGDHTYYLLIRDNDLVLNIETSATGRASNRALSFAIPENGRVTEMRLEPWLSRGLCAIVEVSQGGKYQYSCITLSAPAPSEGYDSASAMFYETRIDHSILALNGTFRGDSVLALLGTVKTKDGLARVVTEGVIYLDDCPAPPNRGSISKFQANTEIDPALIRLLKRGN